MGRPTSSAMQEKRTIYWLTDAPHALAAFLPGDLHWSARPDVGGTEVTKSVWAVLGEGRPLYGVRQGPGDAAPCSTTVCVLIDAARNSQFDALTARPPAGTAWPAQVIALALAGDRFRGQRGRPWQAIRGNLHFTGQYDIDADATESAPALTALPAVATREAICSAADRPVEVRIKWVNDLLVDGRKIAGVLTASQAQGTRIRRVTFGIGINVQHAPAIPQHGTTIPAGSLADWSIPLPRLFHSLLQSIADNLKRIESGAHRALVDTYRTACDVVGRPVALWPEDYSPEQTTSAPIARGTVTEILPDLSLRIDGLDQPIRRGRLTYTDTAPQIG